MIRLKVIGELRLSQRYSSIYLLTLSARGSLVKKAQGAEISIVIPTHGGRQSVRTTVAKLLGQESARDIEIIVVSDGEGSKTRATLDDIDDPRLIILEQVRSGSASARNLGLRAARHPWVAFVDDDDVPRDNWLQTWRNGLTESTIAGTAGVAYWRRGRLSHTTACRLSFEDQTMSACSILAGAYIVRRNILEAIGGFDERLKASQNQDLGLRICEYVSNNGIAGTVFSTSEVVIDLYPQEPNLRSHRYGRAYADSARLFLDRYAHRLELDPQAQAAFLRIIARDERLFGSSRLARKAAWRAWRLRPASVANTKSLILALAPILASIDRDRRG